MKLVSFYDQRCKRNVDVNPEFVIRTETETCATWGKTTIYVANGVVPDTVHVVQNMDEVRKMLTGA